MALLLKTKNDIGRQRQESQRDHNDKYHHYKTRRKRKHAIGSQSEEKIIKRSTRRKKDISYSRKNRKMETLTPLMDMDTKVDMVTMSMMGMETTEC